MNSLDFVDQNNRWPTITNAWQDMVCTVSKKKLVLLVRHPDEELFGCAALLKQWAPHVSEALIIYVANDDVCVEPINADLQAGIAAVRRFESHHAFTALKLDTCVRVMELKFAHAQGRTFQSQLEEKLSLELDSNTIVIAPYWNEGQSDFHAIGDSVRRLSEQIGFEVHFYPIWLWVGQLANPSSVCDAFAPINKTRPKRHNSAISDFEYSSLLQGLTTAWDSSEFENVVLPSPYQVLMH